MNRCTSLRGIGMVLGWVLLLTCGGWHRLSAAVELPPGFEQTVFVAGLHDPNAMEFAPDGRLFVLERISGRVRIVRDGTLMPEPFITVNVPPEKPGKREEAGRPGFRYQGIYHYGTYRSSGLRGISFDPEFEENGHVYLYYMNDDPRVNRVSRFTASGSNPDVAEADSEKVLLDVPMHTRNTSGPIPDGGSHNGGALLFGRDGKLYASVGDGWNPAPKDGPQDLSVLMGKVLRINRDGSVPEGNPFRDVGGARPEIWALGFRNPYTMAVHPETGDIYVNDVVWGKETVYELVRGGNYRHPSFQGEGEEQYPMHTAAGLIAGGAWYFGAEFPESYRGSYFLSDWRGNVIRRLTGRGGEVVPFAVGVQRPTYIKQGPDDALYWLSANYETLQGTVYRIGWRGGSEELTPGRRVETDFDPHAGLSFHWPLDDGSGELARDISGAGRHGRLKGHAAWSSPGDFPKHLKFESEGGRVELGMVDLPSDRFTMTAWIKADSFLPGMADNRILSKATGTDEQDHWWMLGSVRKGESVGLRFRLKAGGRTSTLIAHAGGLTTGRWIHVAATYDGRSMRLYQDAQLVGIIGKEGVPDRNPEVAAWLGDNPPQAQRRPFHGALRDVRIYGRDLGAGEVLALMEWTHPRRRQGEDRSEVLAAYRPALELDGDREAGRLIFEERCVICHREGAGADPGIAPDLGESGLRGKEWLLESILDPSRDNAPEFWNYSVATDNDSLQGILVHETETQVTLRTLDAQERILERSSIRTFRRQEQSMMPEGLEAELSPREFAGLLDYLIQINDSGLGEGGGVSVKLTADAEDPGVPGLACYKIETPTATYFLEKFGAGLSSLLDKDGNNWINFDPRPGTGAGGEWRGFPNAVYREAGNYFHARNSATDPAITKVERVDPDRITISAAASNGPWAGRYDFFPTHCTFTMTKMPPGHKYWVLYEGTPGGEFDETDWWMTSVVQEPQPMTRKHDGDIPAPEWMVFGDTGQDRVLFMLHHEDDGHPDRFYQMEHKMTVFGFGRSGLTKFLDDVPRQFSIGLLETRRHNEIRRALEGILQGGRAE